MTDKQSTVIWLGLMLIALNLIIHISEFKSIIFSGPVNTTATLVNVSVPSGAQPTPPNTQLA